MQKALAVVVFLLVVLSHAASAAQCRATIAASTPAERAELLLGAVERFSAERPDLTPDQTQFLREAVRLGEDIATLGQDERRQAAFTRRATQFMARARELFSNNELGALFTSMGPMQVWLAQQAAMPAYCDCPPNPCPGGVCVMGCVSWEGSDGVHHVALCQMPTPPGGVESPFARLV